VTSIALAEELLLLGYDDESGKATVSRIGLDLGMAAAVMIELALAGRIRLGEGKTVAVIDPSPTSHPIADAALARIVADSPHTVASWVQRLRHGLREGVLADLCTRGVVRELDETALGFITLHRYPVLDPEPEREVRARLAAALSGERPPDERTAALAALIVAVRMEPTLRLPGEEQAAAHQRLEEMALLAGFGGLASRTAQLGGGGVSLEDSTVPPSVSFLVSELHRAIATALGGTALPR
jgi:Golgi phosphoprotein 3 (GPP34)